MTELEMLQQEVEKLQKTVAMLQQGTVRVETNQAKLTRMKNEIVTDMILSKLRCDYNPNQLCEFRKNVTIVTNDIWQMQTGFEKPGFKKMHEILFDRPDSEERLESYLSVFRKVCEFMAAQYEGHWKSFH
jgi:hypothetical protein